MIHCNVIKWNLVKSSCKSQKLVTRVPVTDSSQQHWGEGCVWYRINLQLLKSSYRWNPSSHPTFNMLNKIIHFSPFPFPYSPVNPKVFLNPPKSLIFHITTDSFVIVYLLNILKKINPNHPESIKIHPPVLEDFGGFRIPPHWACGGFWWIQDFNSF